MGNTVKLHRVLFAAPEKIYSAAPSVTFPKLIHAPVSGESFRTGRLSDKGASVSVCSSSRTKRFLSPAQLGQKTGGYSARCL